MLNNRISIGNLVFILSLIFLMLVPVTNSTVTYFAAVTITPIYEYAEVEAVQVTRSIHSEMDRDQFGFLPQYFETPNVVAIEKPKWNSVPLMALSKF